MRRRVVVLMMIMKMMCAVAMNLIGLIEVK